MFSHHAVTVCRRRRDRAAHVSAGHQHGRGDLIGRVRREAAPQTPRTRALNTSASSAWLRPPLPPFIISACVGVQAGFGLYQSITVELVPVKPRATHEVGAAELGEIRDQDTSLTSAPSLTNDNATRCVLGPALPSCCTISESARTSKTHQIGVQQYDRGGWAGQVRGMEGRGW